ncbi:hypothetical protein [Thermovirga sp.]|uniref:hypothetical protein n=1 Tax=Thermovirga sp. TaxID=2699834 RepID=UPI0025D1880A|nr:hypothetical protein [Thermovirga sp.]MBO8153770.1 hypothetical protein [Thermovirga sp.]
MRLIVLILSIATLVFFGHGIAGLWGYLVGRPDPFRIAWGLSGGFICAVAAVYLWHRYIVALLHDENKKSKGNEP